MVHILGMSHTTRKYWHVSARFANCIGFIAVFKSLPESLGLCCDAFRWISWICLVGSIICFLFFFLSVISRHGIWLHSDRVVARESTWIHGVFQSGHRGQYCVQFYTPKLAFHEFTFRLSWPWAEDNIISLVHYFRNNKSVNYQTSTERLFNNDDTIARRLF